MGLEVSGSFVYQSGKNQTRKGACCGVDRNFFGRNGGSPGHQLVVS